MSIESWDDLQFELLLMRSSAIYDIFGQQLLFSFLKENRDTRDRLNSLKTELPEGTIVFGKFLQSLEEAHSNIPLIVKRRASYYLTAGLLKSVFRITQSYCISSRNIKLFEADPCYQAARITVNAASHSLRWEFNKSDKKVMPVSYRGISIDSSLEGTEFNLTQGQMLSMVDDIIAFVKSKSS